MCRPFPAQISIQRSMAKQQLERKMSRSYKSPFLLPKNVTFIHGTKKNLVSLLLLQFFLVLSLFSFKQNSLSLPRQPGTSHPHHVHMSSLLFLAIFSISSKLSGHVFLHQGTSCLLQPHNRNLDKSNSREGRFICLRSEFQGIQSVGLKEETDPLMQGCDRGCLHHDRQEADREWGYKRDRAITHKGLCPLTHLY